VDKRRGGPRGPNRKPKLLPSYLVLSLKRLWPSSPCFQVPSLSAVKGFFLEKGQSGKTELPPRPKANPQREKDKVRMALSAPPNYQQEVKEIPLYRDIDREEETPNSIPKAKEGTPPLLYSRSSESKSLVQLQVSCLPNIEKSLQGRDIQRVHTSLPKLTLYMNIQIPFVHLQN
jgi:hypothetical protein